MITDSVACSRHLETSSNISDTESANHRKWQTAAYHSSRQYSCERVASFVHKNVHLFYVFSVELYSSVQLIRNLVAYMLRVQTTDQYMQSFHCPTGGFNYCSTCNITVMSWRYILQTPSPFISLKRNNNITIKWQKNRTARHMRALTVLSIVTGCAVAPALC